MEQLGQMYYEGKWDGAPAKEPRAFVYRNLANGCWSVKVSGLVALHADTVLLRNAEFVVSEAGRQRVLKERRKNVHAGVRGEVVWASVINVRHPFFGMHKHRLQDLSDVPVLRDGVGVTYNPYESGFFTYFNGDIAYAEDDDFVLLDSSRKVWLGKLAA